MNCCMRSEDDHVQRTIKCGESSQYLFQDTVMYLYGVTEKERDPLEWHYLPTKYHDNLPRGSKIISETRTHTHTGDLISLLSFLDSRLKNCDWPRFQLAFETGTSQMHIRFVMA
jgi:hypothetical protein